MSYKAGIYRPPQLRKQNEDLIKHIQEGNIEQLQQKVHKILQPVDFPPIKSVSKRHSFSRQTRKRQDNKRQDNDVFNPFLKTEDLNLFNITIGDNQYKDIKEDQKDNYVKFLSTSIDAITKVNRELTNNIGKIVSFFPAEKGIKEPAFLELYRNLFDKKTSSPNSDTTQDGFIYPNYFKNMFTNEYTKRLKKVENLFGDKTKIDDKMKAALNQRVSSLKSCYEFLKPTTENDEAKLNFYISEFLREIDDMEKPNKERCRNINWGLMEKNLFENQSLKDEQIIKISEFVNSNQDEKKLLGTFLDDSIFNEDQSINFEKVLKERKRQYIFGFRDTIKKLGYESYSLLFVAIVIIYDLFYSCGQYVNWNLLTNLLYDYCALEQKDMLFPIRFLLERKENLGYFPIEGTSSEGKYNLNYSYKNKPKYIFDPKLFKFMGVISIKTKYEFYKTKDKGRAPIKVQFLLFVFKKIFKDRETKLPILYDLIKNYNLDSGVMPEYLILNHKLQFIEYGNVFKNPAITHIEFNHFLENTDIPVEFYRHKPSIEKGIDMLFLRKVDELSTTPEFKAKTEQMDLEKVIIKREASQDDQNLFINIVSDNEEIQKGGKEQSKDLYLPITGGNIYNQVIEKLFKIINNEETINNLINVYPYIFITSIDFRILGFFQKTEFDKLIPKYLPIINTFFQHYEVIKKFDLFNPSSVLQIGVIPDFSEALMYNNYNIKDITFIYPRKYKNVFSKTYSETFDKKYNEEMDKIIYYFNKNIYKLNIINFDDTIDNIFNIKLNKKKDLIIINNIFYEKGISSKDIEELQNFLLKIVEVVFAIKNLEENGNLVILFNTMVFQHTSELYIWLKSHFKESYLYYPEISNQIKRTGLYAVFKGFKHPSKSEMNKITNYMNKIIKQYPNSVFDFNVVDQELREYYNISKPITEQNLKTKPINLLLNLNKNDKVFNEIIEFNNERYSKQLKFINKYNSFVENKNENKKYFPTREQITSSIEYCKKWDIDYFPYYESTKDFKDQFGKKILNEMYSDIVPINYTFKNVDTKMTHKNKTKKTKNKTKKTNRFSNKKILLDPAIFPVNNQIAQTGLMIDSRRDLNIDDESKQLPNYSEAAISFRYYKSNPSDLSNNLGMIVREKIRRNVSQAWLKFYEILAETNIIPKNLSGNKTTYKSFHLCEAPGSFIDCLDYYIKKETNIKDFNWNAQSYKAVKGKSYFGDDFGIIKAYPDHWKWGADGTGDITKCDNILSYKELCKDIDLITSDCGIPMFQPGYERILFSSMVAISYLLPVDGSMIFKILTPINKPITWNIIYLWFTSFNEFRFFKPIQNSQSREFYIIGKGFKGIEESIINKLLDLVKDQSDKFMSVDLFNGKYPESFVNQIADVSKELVNNWSFTIQKQIYYNDNIESIKKNKWFMKTIQYYIKKKNLDFIEKYKLHKIK
jgi:hypothetical protein